jgi:hypothetical protein
MVSVLDIMMLGLQSDRSRGQTFQDVNGSSIASAMGSKAKKSNDDGDRYGVNSLGHPLLEAWRIKPGRRTKAYHERKRVRDANNVTRYFNLYDEGICFDVANAVHAVPTQPL